MLEDGKEYRLESQLRQLLRREGITTVDDLVVRLVRGRDTSLRRELVEALTITETSFFRDAYPFELVRDEVLPALLNRKGAVAIWSAACASGQEPYSLAILIREHFPQTLTSGVRIIASDISEAMLTRGRRGLYSDLEVNRGLTPALQDGYFSREEGGWQICSELRDMVEWRQLNLAGSWPPLPTLDIVFLRNVMIYFDLETKREILNRVRDAMAVGGHLFLGSAESTLQLDEVCWRNTFGRAGCYELVRQGGAQ